MVGLVIVSHSEALAAGVVALAREMASGELVIEAAGGVDGEEGQPILGTDAERVRAAIEAAAAGGDGVLVMMDLGSALMSAEFAAELVEGVEIVLSDAPLVEGAVAAAAAASGGASLAEVAAEARGALGMKRSQLGGEDPNVGDPTPAAPEEPADGEAAADASVEVVNAIGLHARPAARVVALARGFDARLSLAIGDGDWVSAASLTGVVSLGARQGQTVRARASGPEARRAVDAFVALARDGFGDDDTATPAPAATPSRAQAAAPAEGVLTGVPVSAGVVVGPAHRLGGAPELVAPDVELAGDAAALDRALDSVREALAADRERVTRRGGGDAAEVFDAHLALLDDDALLRPARHAVDQGHGAPRAWYDAVQQVADVYRGLDEPLLRERATDVLDVGGRVLAALTGATPPSRAPHGIVIAGELTPADAAALDPETVTGIATAHGSPTAHAAILARALGLPAVVGLGDALLQVADGTEVLLDGGAGTLAIAPDAATAAGARERAADLGRRRATARAHATEPAVTRDGTHVEVLANLGDAAAAAEAVALGAEGVGLLRTEFLYLDRPQLPSEDEQAETLTAIARALDGRPLVVRTLDAGADKPLPALPTGHEDNPFLGVRGVRLSLARPEVLATQLRAVLRVVARFPGAIRLMLPMVSVVDEVIAVRAMLDQARHATGVDAALPLGIMVEVPAAALAAAQLAEHVEFFSIGTNDLTQYTMAAERGNERLAPLLTGLREPVLELVTRTVRGAAGRPVAVCGELAGDPEAAAGLVRAGVRELSMSPSLIPEAKAALRELTV